MALILQPASYKGFRFLTSSVRTQGGQKTATHEFPGSNRRSVQDLGQSPDVFTFIAIIHGDDYVADISRFKQILSEGGFGDLIHPSQGTFRVKVTGYSLVEDDAEKGRARFEIDFVTASSEVQPVARRSNVGAVAKQTSVVEDALTDRIVADYDVDASKSGNFLDAVNQVNEIAASFIKNANQFTPDVPGLADFKRTVLDFTSNATRLVQLPITFAANIFDLFAVFDAIQTTSGDSFRELLGFFGFGDDDIPNSNNTVGLIERTDNRDIIRSTIQAGALAEAYREASLIEFQTVPEIDAVASELDAQYRAIKDEIGDDPKEEMSILRDQVRKLFDDQRLTASQIIELDLPVLPAIVQAQDLYGEDAQDRVALLIEANDTKDTSFLGGRATKVLTA